MKSYLFIPLLLLGFEIFAQESALDSVQHLPEISIVGDKNKTIPGSGQYISTRQLSMLNQSNVNYVLRSVPGVNVRDEEGFGLRPNIGLRGTSVNRSAKITLMEDGILIAPAPYADPSAYYFPTFARMQAVEVLKGSSQIKYGPYTVGGAVNLISTAIPKTFKGFAQLSYGSFGTNQQRVWVGDSKSNFDYVFEVNRLASNGFKELDNDGKTGFDRRDVMGKLRWHTSENANIQQSLTFKFLNTTEEGNESYLGLTYEDYKENPLRRYAATQNDLLDLKHSHISLTHTIAPTKGFTISTVGYYSTTFRDWARVNTIGGQSLNNILANPSLHQIPYQIMVGQTDGNIDYQSAARTYFSKGIQSNAQYSFNTNDVFHKIQVGLRYHSDQADRYATKSVYAMSNGTMILTNAGVKGNQENQIRNATAFASYIQYDIVFKGLKLSPGVRYENIKFEFENYGNADNGRLGSALKTASNDLGILLPGLGLKYDFNGYASAFAGVHKGFSPPGMPSVTSTSGQAKEETATNYELGYRYEKRGLNLQLVGFINDYKNILGSDNVSGGGAGSGDMFNAGNALTKGLELSFEYNLLHKEDQLSAIKLPLNITYTYTDARFQDVFVNAGGDWGSGQINRSDLIPFVTPHLLTVSLGISYHKLNASLVSRYVGETRIKPGQAETVVPTSGVNYNDVNAIAGFMLLDFTANYQFSKYLTAFTTLHNITNNKGISSNLPNGYRPNMPLNANIGVKLDF